MFKHPIAKAVMMAAGVVAFASLSGCSDSKPVKAPPPSSSTPAPKPAAANQPSGLEAFRGSLADSTKQLDSTMAALAELTDPQQQDLRGAYNRYSDQLARMNEHAQTIKAEADGMRASRDAYFAKWEEKTSDIDNPTIRASAEARRKRLRDAHDEIVTASGEARDAYVPFMKDLQDIKKYLSNDLTKSSIADLGDAVKKVQASGAAVKQKIDSVLATLDKVQAGA